MVQAIKRIFRKVGEKKEPSSGNEEIKIQAREKILFLLRDKKYKVHSKCKECGEIFSASQVINKFSKKEYKLHIICSCGNKIFPLINVDGVNYKFLSPYVVLTFLKPHSVKEMSPENIEFWNDSLYHSAIFHFGTLKNAFSFIGYKYRYNEIIGWEEKARPLIGLFSLSVISKVVGVSEKKLQKIYKVS